MKRILSRMIVLPIVFIIAVIGIEMLNNREEAVVMTEMELPSLPLIYISSEGITHNVLRGYIRDVDVQAINQRAPMASSVITDNFSMTLQIHENEQKVQQMEYTLLSQDGERVISRNRYEALQLEQEDLALQIRFPKSLEIGETYLLKVTMFTEEDQAIYYYSTVSVIEKEVFKAQLNTVNNFHHKTFDSSKSEEIEGLLKTKKSKGVDIKNHVTLYSPIDHIMWDTNVEKMNVPIPEVLELDESGGSIVLSYVVGTKKGEFTAYANVVERYQVQKKEEAYVISAYERTISELFVPGLAEIKESKINISAGDSEDIEAQWTEDGRYVVFEKERQLFMLDVSNNTIIKIFSFEQTNKDYVQDNYDGHGIKILSLNELGNITYMVYGYMNTGSYEGENGILINQYIREENRNEMKVFIPIEESYQHFKQDAEQFSYVNEKGILYFIMNHTLYGIDVEGKQSFIVADQLQDKRYAFSQDFSSITWQGTQNDNENEVIERYNFELGESYQIKAKDSERVRIIGYMGQEVAIGFGRVDQILKTLTGEVVFPMYQIQILDPLNQVLKHYATEDIYVTNGNITDMRLELERVTIHKQGNDPKKNKIVFTEITKDYIMHSSQGAEEKVQFIHEINESQLQEIWLTIKDTAIPMKLGNISAKETVINQVVSMELIEGAKGSPVYYVYLYDEMVREFNELPEAINNAREIDGQVWDGNQLIWKKNNRNTKHKLENFVYEPADDVYQSVSSIQGIVAILGYGNIYADSQSIANQLKQEDKQYEIVNNHIWYGDPHKGYVGNLEDLTKLQLGVYIDPMISVLQSNMNHEVLNISNTSLDTILEYVYEGAPVLVNLATDESKDEQWLTAHGLIEVSVGFESILIIGYDRNNITYVDYQEQKINTMKKSDFEIRWNRLGKQALTYLP